MMDIVRKVIRHIVYLKCQCSKCGHEFDVADDPTESGAGYPYGWQSAYCPRCDGVSVPKKLEKGN